MYRISKNDKQIWWNLQVGLNFDKYIPICLSIEPQRPIIFEFCDSPYRIKSKITKLWTSLVSIFSSDMWSFNNYVDILHSIYPLSCDPPRTIHWLPPPYSCPRSYWMTPILELYWWIRFIEVVLSGFWPFFKKYIYPWFGSCEGFSLKL